MQLAGVSETSPEAKLVLEVEHSGPPLGDQLLQTNNTFINIDTCFMFIPHTVKHSC